MTEMNAVQPTVVPSNADDIIRFWDPGAKVKTMKADEKEDYLLKLARYLEGLQGRNEQQNQLLRHIPDAITGLSFQWVNEAVEATRERYREAKLPGVAATT